MIQQYQPTSGRVRSIKNDGLAEPIRSDPWLVGSLEHAGRGGCVLVLVLDGYWDWSMVLVVGPAW